MLSLAVTEAIREHAEALRTLGPGFRDSGFTCCIHKLRTMTDATVQIVPLVEEKRWRKESSVASPQQQESFMFACECRKAQLSL